jgi:2-methylcitrate dehydratase
LSALKKAAGPVSIAATPSRSSFSTMASLQSASAATPSPSAGKGYDPEILDIASYVHNQKIDSELAVSGEPKPGTQFCPPQLAG